MKTFPCYSIFKSVNHKVTTQLTCHQFYHVLAYLDSAKYSWAFFVCHYNPDSNLNLSMQKLSKSKEAFGGLTWQSKSCVVKCNIKHLFIKSLCFLKTFDFGLINIFCFMRTLLEGHSSMFVQVIQFLWYLWKYDLYTIFVILWGNRNKLFIMALWLVACILCCLGYIFQIVVFFLRILFSML